uniref:DUF834 domain-containing protein n=1 Tax=Oryza meridionalis TaxID=40149 RepID=A0A0E0D2F7_9ORYZ
MTFVSAGGRSQSATAAEEIVAGSVVFDFGDWSEGRDSVTGAAAGSGAALAVVGDGGGGGGGKGRGIDLGGRRAWGEGERVRELRAA